MAYGDDAYQVRLLKRAIGGYANFSGRSRRTEFLYYWIAAAIMMGVVSVLFDATLPSSTSHISKQILLLLFEIPTVALFSRRAHDQGRSGWLAILLVAAVGFGLFDFVHKFSIQQHPILDIRQHTARPFLWIEALIGIACLFVIFAPGDTGPNRFGADPRTE